jgi:hypothetical protein
VLTVLVIDACFGVQVADLLGCGHNLVETLIEQFNETKTVAKPKPTANRGTSAALLLLSMLS